VDILRGASDIGTIDRMSAPQPRPNATPMSAAAITGLIVGIAALLILPVAEGIRPFALILGVAGALVGVFAAVNAGRPWLAFAAIAVGLVAAIIVLVLTLTA
jgi:uncharacterized membrane protein YeaQ/YmgE (transglycosylase-associated protein family)